MMKTRWLVGCIGVVAAAAVTTGVLSAQVEIDRVVSRVDGRIITQSDIRQARTLKLVDDTATDDATRRALENRLLVLNELRRMAPLPPASDDDVRGRRSEWVSALGGASTDDLLRQGAMTEPDLDGWMRDDLRIRAYLQRQFGMLAGAERERAIADWLTRLRQRADLPR